MPHEILSIKLHELDEKISYIYSRLLMIETADHDQVRREKELLLQECKALEKDMQEQLLHSESPIVASCRDTYDELTVITKDVRQKLNETAKAPLKGDGIDGTEKKILMAEYALDFAVLAADYALLFSLDALDARMSDEEREAIIS